MLLLLLLLLLLLSSLLSLSSSSSCCCRHHRCCRHCCNVVVVIIIIIIIIIISFMQGTYSHIPETNYVPREHSVAAILLFLFMALISLVSVLNLLYFYISTFRSMCAVPNMAVFCSSLTSCFLVYCSRIF